MRRDVCERPSCLTHDAERTLRVARAQAASVLHERAAPDIGPMRAAALPVVWIQPHDSTLVPLPDSVRDDLTQYLRSQAGLDLPQPTPPAAAEPASEAGAVNAIEGRLCGWCGGRCCRYGGQSHGYLDGSHLQRWAASHLGATLADAVQVYVDHLPTRHVQGSCAYHGDQGCTLDRDMRSETCNRFACDGLRDVQKRSVSGDTGDWLFVMGLHADADRAVLVSRNDLRPLPEPEAL